MKTRRFLRFVTLVSLSVLAAMAFLAPAAAQTGARFYSETGHWVRDPFLAYVDATGGLTRYGYPITDEYLDPQSGLKVQYFQNARLEWHPENPEPYRIQLGLLGDELGQRKPPIPVSQIPPRSHPSCQYFEATGHTACYAFLKYWRTHGGLDAFGYPIAEYTVEADRVIQYFQRAKMIWHAGKPDDERVKLAPLGEIYYRFAQLDPERLRPHASAESLAEITSLRVRAAVLNAVLPDDATQTAYVVVSDQLGWAVPQAAATLIIHSPAGDETIQLAPTNDKGWSAHSFPAGRFRAGTMVALEFIITYPGVPDANTRTSYLIWYY